MPLFTRDIPVWLMQNRYLVGFCFVLFFAYFWITRTETGWVSQACILRLISTTGLCFSCFFLILSVTPSVRFGVAPYLCPFSPISLQAAMVFFSVCFRACSCVFGCMCICINMHVETSRQPWFLSSGTLPMSFETGLSLTWGSSNWLDCLARGCGILLSLPPAQGLQVHPPRLPFWHLFWGSSSDPHDGKARTSLTEPFPQPQCNYWNIVYCMFWNMYVWLFFYIVWFRKFLGGFFLLPIISSVSNMSKTHMCCYV